MTRHLGKTHAARRQADAVALVQQLSRGRGASLAQVLRTMCGIAGIVYRDRQRPVAESLVRRMCDALRHRGPDDEGLYVAGAVGLGMRRLSIIDLAGGRQPIFNEDGSKVIVFNGEIYNYRELRGELRARGHQLRTAGDTETVLHLYEDAGAACAEALRGMFAYAIWDSTTETLVLTRDRFGIKPLYVVTGDWGIAFASELKALHAAELTSRELDWEALDAYLQLGYVPAPLTPFVDVRKLEPGHHLTWRRELAPRTTRYWHFPTHEVQPDREQEERVREWLDETVSAHMVSDVPVAAFLSGGLDSSAVVTSMARHGDASPPHAFTARYTGSGAAAADETGLARSLATRLGAGMTVIDIHPNVRDIIEPIVRALDEPHADDSAMPTWLLSQAVGSRYKVALTGIGGDELFAGYRRHVGLLAAQHYAKLPAGVRRVAGWASRMLPEPRSGGLGTDRLKRFLRAGNGTVPDRFLGLMNPIANGERLGLYTASVRPHVSGESARRRFHDVFRAGGASLSGLSAGLYLDYTTFLPDDVLALNDRLSMAHSLEVRVPFVDHVLVEAAFPLPQRVKIGPWWEPKRLLRRALRPRLTEAHLRAPKRGFVGPTSAWLRNELSDLLKDELSAERQQRLGYFDVTAVQTALRDHLTGRQNRERILWALLCFSVWHRLYRE